MHPEDDDDDDEASEVVVVVVVVVVVLRVYLLLASKASGQGRLSTAAIAEEGSWQVWRSLLHQSLTDLVIAVVTNWYERNPFHNCKSE